MLLTSSPCHILSHLLAPPLPSCVTYFMDGSKVKLNSILTVSVGVKPSSLHNLSISRSPKFLQSLWQNNFTSSTWAAVRISVLEKLSTKLLYKAWTNWFLVDLKCAWSASVYLSITPVKDLLVVKYEDIFAKLFPYRVFIAKEETFACSIRLLTIIRLASTLLMLIW